ncbi:GNAT family N-acetyltransferase [Bacillus thuringiensis]|uniref:GNAT family N-acetyltransferase n=1 Tax=Bacillus thuringiensis TaxID=1428 RepID=UPI000BF64613|nr:GNAT family N-acetyltransferase [Bacillus thuringiensis]PEW37836.1 GNAT family N-acetyltransferase [Bacillus thuringiensis]PEY66274.1 GNAT family N-acetyltransferase [Bacillus thuringiensis]PFA08028.1 GNAT family N-acetyltransferase [Bacillus thuringiensis]PFK10531.1 GNAT family N-acetyltransferase [Bacillus thuringiensis]PFM26007.1 GNAT family N-acetyltransferase [Bacillus thuringiensis]
MIIEKICNENRASVNEFFATHWGGNQMVISTGVYDCSLLEGFVCFGVNRELLGLITYNINEKECEIISLDSIQEKKGIGSRLLSEVETTAKKIKLKKVTLITTNDNLHALNFYQKRGYQCIEVRNNAVEKARNIKPTIPLIASNGIPIRDEFILMKCI